MKYFFYFFFLCLNSCGYPDIDSVPKFNNFEITKQESVDMCKLANNDSDNKFIQCLSLIKQYSPNFKDLNINEEYSIKLCKLIYEDNRELLDCISKYYKI